MGYIRRLLPLIVGANLHLLPSTNDFAEMCAGDAAVSDGMDLLGFVGERMDLRYNQHHDFLTPIGFILALAAVMKLKPGGLFWGAPPCATWVWMSRHSSGRSFSVLGKKYCANIAEANAFVARLIYLLTLCFKRQVYWIIEQPKSSVLWEHPRARRFLLRWQHFVSDALVDMGCFNLRCQKSLLLRSWAPYLPNLCRSMTRKERKWMKAGHQLQHTRHTTSECGKKKRTGKKKPKLTQAYPMGFGCAHALCYQEHVLSLPSASAANTMPQPLNLSPSDTEDSEIGTDDEYLFDLIKNQPDHWVSCRRNGEGVRLQRSQ